MDALPQELLSPEVAGAYAGLFGLRVVGALAIFIIGRWLVKVSVKFINQAMEKAGLDRTLRSFASNALYALGLTFVVLAVLGQLGVETTSLIAVLGAAGLAVGFALQGSLANLAAGVMITIFRPFRLGHYIEAANTAGTVEELNILNTTLRTPDNKIVIIPNSAVMGGSITNYSARDTRRIDLIFSISYGDDMKKAKEILQRVAAEDDRILPEPAPVIAVFELGENSVNLILRPWVKSSDFWATRFALIEKVKTEFDSAGITIPFPQRDVHMKQAA